MDSTILASILGAIATVLAGILSPYITNKMQEKRKAKILPAVPNNRQETLYGSWIGEMDQKVGIEKIIGIHALEIRIENYQPVAGTMKIIFKITGDNILDEDRISESRIINLIFDGFIFKFDYVNKDNSAIHFGTVYGKISANGKVVLGEFLGYGLISERFVSGTINLRKKDTSLNRDIG